MSGQFQDLHFGGAAKEPAQPADAFAQLKVRQAQAEKERQERLAAIKARYANDADQRRAEREQQQTEQRAAVEARQREAAEQAEQRAKSSAFETWKRLGGGADQAAFDAAWPALRDSIMAGQITVQQQKDAALSAKQTKERF